MELAPRRGSGGGIGGSSEEEGEKFMEGWNSQILGIPLRPPLSAAVRNVIPA